MTYQEALHGAYRGDFKTVPHCLLCLDPGETTGYAVFIDGILTTYGQIDTIKDSTNGKVSDKWLDWDVLIELFNNVNPTHVICEDYRVYAHKLERHTFSPVPTLRLIGGIDMVCNSVRYGRVDTDDSVDASADAKNYQAFTYYGPIPIYYAMAVMAKGFVTDERLKAWDFWRPGMRHARDAIRHGIYFLIVTNRPKGVK